MLGRRRDSEQSCGDSGSGAAKLLHPSAASSRESGSRWWSGSSRRARPPSSSPRLSLLQSTASLEPTNSSSGSSGVLTYHPHTGSIQFDSSDTSGTTTTASPAPFPAPSPPQRAPVSRCYSERRRTTRYHQHQPRSCWKRLGCCSRVPRGVGSLVVFLLNVIESFAFNGAIDGTLRILFGGSGWHETTLVLLVKFTAGRLMYPIAGLLSDVYTGRYAMIQFGIALFWSAFALLSLFLALASCDIGNYSFNTLVVPIIAYVLISAASGAIEVAIIPFGVDQLSQGATSHEQSSYFYFYYVGRQLGNLTGLLSFYGLSRFTNKDVERNDFAAASVQSLAALVGMTLSLVLIWWFKNFLFRDKQRENPLKEVANVVFYAATVRNTPPVARRAFRYGEGRKRRVEKAKSRYDGPYTSEEVEDVKTFCKILLILFSLGLCFMTYTGVYILLEYQVTNIYHLENFPDLFTVWNSLTIIIAAPIVNFFIVPCLPSWTMRERVGLGVALIALSALLAAYLEWCVFPLVGTHRQFLWLILPIVTVSLGEMMLFITGLEFIYAQSPEQMKGLLTGLFYLVFGLSSGAASLFFYFYPVNFNQLHSHACYFTIYAVVGAIGFVMYVVVACLYSNRERPEDEDL